MSRAFWAIFAVLLAVWLVMNLGTAPRIEEMAGGLRLLDMRFTGYSLAEARQFIAAIGNEGVQLYLGTQLWLDMVFPPLLGAVLFLCYRRLFPGLLGLVIGTFSLISIVAVDYLENAALAAMLRAGADGLTAEMAARASTLTTLKWSLAFIGLLALIVGVTLLLRRRWVAASERR